MRKFQVTVNGNTYEVEVEELGQGASVAMPAPVAPVVSVGAAPKVAPAPKPAAPKVAPQGGEGAHKVVAPMPGKIVDVKVKVGQQIKEGDLVAILEAMKMENEIFATASGTVASTNASSGAMVEANDIIVTIN